MTTNAHARQPDDSTPAQPLPSARKGRAVVIVLWRFVRLLMKWRYGVRGAIKPPLNWNRANSLWYRWRYRCWLVEEKIYQRTGLPDEWWEWVRKPGLAQRLREHADRVAGGGPSDSNYDPETLMLEHEAADALERLQPNANDEPRGGL